MSSDFDAGEWDDWGFSNGRGALRGAPSLALRDNERAWLDAYQKRLAEEFPNLVQEVLVYGPRSRGQKQPNPGLNLLVIISEGGWEDKDSIGLLGHQVDMDNYFAAPLIMVYTRDEWLDRERLGADVFRNVNRSHVRV